MGAVSRRSFLKGATVSVAGLSLGGALGLRPLGEPARAAAAGNFPPAEVLDRLLARALRHGGDYADVYVEHRILTQVRLISGRIDSFEHGVAQGGGVRALRGEQTGYAFAETFDPDELARAADSAAAIASGGGGARQAPLKAVEFPRTVAARRPIEEASFDSRVSILERVDRAARAVSPAITQVVVDCADEAKSFRLATSEGRLADDDLPLIQLRVTAYAAADGRGAEGMYRGSRRAGMEFLAGDLPERAGRFAAEQALRMLGAEPAPTGEMPVVVAAGGGVMFHEAVGHGLEADGILREASVFAGRIGQKVASDLVTLYDDARIPGERGSFNIDDEGTPAQHTPLIERGVLVGYLHDWRTANRMGAALTGNGRRQSFRYPAIPRMTNTNLEPGGHGADEIIRETASGIYAVHFGGGEVDTTSGQFTFGLREAYLIENGRLGAPIRGANLVGSGIQVLERIDRVAADFEAWPGTCGKDGQWVPVTSGCPTLRISSITVGGTA
ncbi:MAG: TldD/PmbA family protein [Candidatus Eisenbacteria bacterium]|uniref:TldD/PmbA family protein n=1 Tax=Eiseniibacteriota bacterium TaxID=2212470 RepID=A0A938BQU9_UNCEI|nr:TldD/PmbA family protein [Candidatus Eisenbacteria bacterium]